MKLPILFLGALVCANAAFADDSTIKLTERKTCTQLKTEIDNLLLIEYPDESTQATLKQLQMQQRANCMPKATGRRTVSRAIASIPVGSSTVAETPDALTEYLTNKKSNCEKLNSEIEKMAGENDESKSDALASMRGVYDMDCSEKHKPETEPAPAAPEKTYEEWAAEFDANLAAGLCGDGTKPNRYGCCTDEVFKDLGNTTFACCPKVGDGLCFPPIK